MIKIIKILLILLTICQKSACQTLIDFPNFYTLKYRYPFYQDYNNPQKQISIASTNLLGVQINASLVKNLSIGSTVDFSDLNTTYLYGKYIFNIDENLKFGIQTNMILPKENQFIANNNKKHFLYHLNVGTGFTYSNNKTSVTWGYIIRLIDDNLLRNKDVYATGLVIGINQKIYKKLNLVANTQFDIYNDAPQNGDESSILYGFGLQFKHKNLIIDGNFNSDYYTFLRLMYVFRFKPYK